MQVMVVVLAIVVFLIIRYRRIIIKVSMGTKAEKQTEDSKQIGEDKVLVEEINKEVREVAHQVETSQIQEEVDEISQMKVSNDVDCVEKKNTSSEFEEACYLCVKKILEKNNKDIGTLSYKKNNYFDIQTVDQLLRIKESSRLRYVLVKTKYAEEIQCEFKITQASKNEGKEKRRAHIRSAEDLEVFEKMILEQYEHNVNVINSKEPKKH